MEGRTVRWRAGCLALVAYCCLGGPSQAAEVQVSSLTLVAGRPDVRYGEVHSSLPIIELMRLNASDFGVAGIDLKLRVSGWGRLDALDPDDPQGDVELAFLQGRMLDRRLTVSVGRQVVLSGATRFTYLDGASADVRLVSGLGLAAFGGVPVVGRFAVARGDALFGGRLYFRQNYSTEFGASFVQLLDHGLVGRQDLGLDARFQPFRDLTVGASGLWSLAESRLVEFEVGPTWLVSPKVQLRPLYRRSAPDLFISRASLFSVFAETEQDELGAELAYDTLSHLSAFASYRSLWTEEGRGDDGRVRVSWRSDRSSRTVLGAQARVFRIPANGYVQERLFGSYRPLPRLTLGLDLDSYQFFERINGARVSFTGNLFGSYQLAPGWQAVLSGSAGTTVLQEARFEVLAKLVYSFPNSAKGRAP